MRGTILFNFFLLLGSCCFSSSVFASPTNANPLVSGILSYTAWNTPLEELNFCIIDGPAKFITQNIFSPPSPLIRPQSIKIIQIDSNNLLTESAHFNQNTCHVLYFANTVDVTQQKVLQGDLKKHLTISEQNADCAIGSTFCLYKNADHFSFKVNLTSLKRSNVRVNSKVLMLANPEGSPK